MTTDPEFSAYIEKMAKQIPHLGDGRSYMIQHKPDDVWTDLAVVDSTLLCDYATRWWLTHRTTKVRGIRHEEGKLKQSR